MSAPRPARITPESIAEDLQIDEVLVLEALDQLVADDGGLSEILDEVDVLQAALTGSGARRLRAELGGAS